MIQYSDIFCRAWHRMEAKAKAKYSMTGSSDPRGIFVGLQTKLANGFMTVVNTNS